MIHLHGLDFASYLPDRRIPILVTLHLPLTGILPVRSSSRRRGVRFVCVSADERRAAAPGGTRSRSSRNGVPVEDDERARARAATSACASGGICPEKGLHLALEARARADSPLLLAGEVHPYPAHERYFAQQIAPLLDGGRRFIGPVAGPAKRRLLGRARFLAVPSLADETSSLVAMEALAAGTPGGAHRWARCPRSLEPGLTGWLVDDVEDLARAFLETDHLRSEDLAAPPRGPASTPSGWSASTSSLYRALAREAPGLAPAPGADRAPRERLAST